MYEAVLWLHVGTLAVTAFGIVVSDRYGLSWVHGRRETLSRERLSVFHQWVGLGLVLMIVSGAVLAAGSRDYFLSNPVFLLKMAFVALLVGNSFVIGALSKVASERAFCTLSHTERARLLLSGAVSTIGWLGAFVAAQFLFF